MPNRLDGVRIRACCVSEKPEFGRTVNSGQLFGVRALNGGKKLLKRDSMLSNIIMQQQRRIFQQFKK